MVAAQLHSSPPPVIADFRRPRLDSVVLGPAPRPVAVDLLRPLVEHEGEVVDKERLLECVWPRVKVGDAVVKVCICGLRRALQDESCNSRYIATIRGQGYRFIRRETSMVFAAATAAPGSRYLSGARTPGTALCRTCEPRDESAGSLAQ